MTLSFMKKMKDGKVKYVDSAYRSAVETEEKFKDTGEILDGNVNTVNTTEKKRGLYICYDHEGNSYEVPGNDKPQFNRTNDSIQ